MRGLTDDERATLLRWQRGEYLGRAADSHAYELFCALYARGLGVDVEMHGPLGLGPYATVTPIGELALRADAAARALGVWP